ncbi:DUF4159 domain-containing protein [Sulfitobacter donghicola]|uniref:LytTR family transcriptional regulator n=1 Tax=Sulfitobacter donghicola DSW-25 = KCTC 12864 = JCM 14565 TaxID=1300350 RepID=A0A073ILX1_9RHOB|nr:DUF4159 domain-containing protein [Sulfitobacter donghicola]KEJ90491.1 LytTR family transcriptional regulator [Sulfitobacter donghicola DSW-25 = KCTC 12864 = JCM 14565]KIN67731.1 N-terminal double-transmembrane domain protein [Sulfitobacter donghicola DSW-25 = KCTC 12864 = JCM 14565]
MMVLGGIGFTAPWLLLSLAALPILWLLLRAVPPAPIKRRFPGVALLLGLKDDETVSDRTPWWLLLLRMIALAAIIIGLAGPVLNPEEEQADGNGPILFVLDGSWAGATRWPQQLEAIEAQLTRASRLERTVGFLTLTNPKPPVFQSADAWRSRLAGLSPEPWQPSLAMLDEAMTALNGVGDFDTLWFSDTLAYEGHETLLNLLQERGTVEAYQTAINVLALRPARYEDGAVQLSALRAASGPTRDITLQAIGRDPAGNGRILASTTTTFEQGETQADIALVLPSELRARITRFDIAGQRSAGASALSDDGLRRREVAVISDRENRERLELLSPHHYIEQALAPTADLIIGAMVDALPANPDVIILADVAALPSTDAEPLMEWVENGGMLVRFAGPRVAASDVSRIDEDPLMPVRLRAGGRSVGGAMSWGEPKALSPFSKGSPFFGLSVPDDVTVTAQVVAQPDPTLSERVIASLSDGTPLVTRKNVGQGQIILFHVTATPEWSTLPLSGLFVEMLERLAVSSSAASATSTALEGTTWVPRRVLNGFGALSDAGVLPGIDGPALVEQPTGPDLRPGLYSSGDRVLARNVLSTDSVISRTSWPANITVRGLTVAPEQPIAGWLLSLAILLLLADVVVSLSLSGRLLSRSNATAAVLGGLLVLSTPLDAQVEQEDFALAATSELVLGHIITGDNTVDEIALAGLRGLSDTLFFRTSVEPANPLSVNLETDELAFFPLLYWPITPNQATPSREAYAKLNAYLRTGGMILFDTRDSNTSRFGASSPNGRKLQELAAPLDIPALEQLPSDHVITRTFYLLQDFPGRHAGRDVWVEAADPNAEQIEGMPFRDLNDGVTPVVIGGNDWAAAWAVNSTGGPMVPVGRGYSGERQREIAYRFGVNLVMHVLTGNYKSDQVHVPALLDRLGQ